MSRHPASHGNGHVTTSGNGAGGQMWIEGGRPDTRGQNPGCGYLGRACRLGKKPQGDAHGKKWTEKGNCQEWASSEEKLEAATSQAPNQGEEGSGTRGKGSRAKHNKICEPGGASGLVIVAALTSAFQQGRRQESGCRGQVQ